MKNGKHYSDTAIIVLHEIYGVNNHILSICEQLQKRGFHTIAPNLLKGKEPFSHVEEQAAYNYFMNNIGFEGALEEVKEILANTRASYQQVYVLGYSAGATVAWLASQTGLCDLCVGFYGSRIRDYLLITPQCPTLLFFPQSERSFKVDELMASLSNIHNVQVEKLAGQHGFANPFSPNYYKKSLVKAWRKIKALDKTMRCIV